MECLENINDVNDYNSLVNDFRDILNNLRSTFVYEYGRNFSGPASEPFEKLVSMSKDNYGKSVKVTSKVLNEFSETIKECKKDEAPYVSRTLMANVLNNTSLGSFTDYIRKNSSDILKDIKLYKKAKTHNDDKTAKKYEEMILDRMMDLTSLLDTTTPCNITKFIEIDGDGSPNMKGILSKYESAIEDGDKSSKNSAKATALYDVLANTEQGHQLASQILEISRVFGETLSGDIEDLGGLEAPFPDDPDKKNVDVIKETCEIANELSSDILNNPLTDDFTYTLKYVPDETNKLIKNIDQLSKIIEKMRKTKVYH